MTFMPPAITLPARMMPRARLIARLLILIGLVVLIFLLVSAYLYQAAPSFYRVHLSPEQSAAAAEVAEAKIISLRNWAEHERAIESARLHGITTSPIGSLQITATDAQINAFFQKWKPLINWDEKVDPYVSDLTLAIVNGQIVLSGDVQDLHTIVSLVFTVHLDNQGRLLARLQRVLAGRLTLPPPLWMAERGRATDALEKLRSDSQRRAKMDASGATNPSGIVAAMSQLLLSALADQPTDPVIFVPIDQHGGIPAKISAIDVGDGHVSLTLDPMSAKERRVYWNEQIH
jgi:hypothetical protein